MTMPTELKPMSAIPCCPDLSADAVCDVADFRRHLIFPTKARGATAT